MTSLSHDTFNQNTKLVKLFLASNSLNTLHEDTFNGLSDLEALDLSEIDVSTLSRAERNSATWCRCSG